MASSSKIRDILVGIENSFRDSYTTLCALAGIENYFLKTNESKVQSEKKIEIKKETSSVLDRFSKSYSTTQKLGNKTFSSKQIKLTNKSPVQPLHLENKSQNKTCSGEPLVKKKKSSPVSTEVNNSLSNVAPGFVYEPKKKKKRNRNRNKLKF